MKKILCIVFVLLLCGCSSGKTDFKGPKPASAKNVDVLYSDEIIDFEFIKLYDIFKIENMIYFDVRISNKSDKDICVCLTDASVNGISVNAESGSQFVISSLKNETNTFSVNTVEADITNRSDVKNLNFKIIVLDTEMKVIKTSENIKIKLQNGKAAR